MRVCVREREGKAHKAEFQIILINNTMSSVSLQLSRKLSERRVRGEVLRQRLLAFPKCLQVLIFKHTMFIHVYFWTKWVWNICMVCLWEHIYAYELTEIMEIRSSKRNFLINYLSKFWFTNSNFSVSNIKSVRLPFFMNQIIELIYSLVITNLRLEFVKEFSWKCIYFYADGALFFI